MILNEIGWFVAENVQFSMLKFNTLPPLDGFSRAVVQFSVTNETSLFEKKIQSELLKIRFTPLSEFGTELGCGSF